MLRPVTPRIPLSPIDLVFTGRGSYPLEFVFAYAGRMDADRLAESLRRTLALFPAVASRLVRTGETYVLDPAEDGCTYAVAKSSTAFGESIERHAFVDPVETVEGRPLARVRLTHTPDGSVLGVGISHAIVDGFSYFYFLSAWSQVFHGRPVPQPALDRGLLASGEAPYGEPLDADSVREACGLFLDERRAEIPRAQLRWTRRLFPRAELSELLRTAQESCPLRLSYNDVVAAWLWQQHVPGWTPAGEKAAFLNCPVDVRRLLSSFPATYFGCAVALATATVEADRLETASLALLARQVRDTVAGVDEARARRSLRTIDLLRRQQGLGSLERLHVAHPRAGLLVTNLSRLPVRDIEFDAGPPVAFDILAPAERCAVVLPAEGGLDVRICAPMG
jgi:hypothetical protein